MASQQLSPTGLLFMSKTVAILMNEEKEWPIFVISLSDATSRRKLLSESLADLSIEFEVVEAIDGRNKLPEQYEHLIDREGTLKGFGRKMTEGEYACALSHQKIYDIVLERDLPGAIILEDDAIPTPGFKRFIETKSYHAGDLIQLDYAFTFVKRIGKKPLFDDVYLRPLYCNSILATGYSVSRKGTEYLHRNSLPITAPADWPCDTTKIGAQVVVPHLVGHPVLSMEQSSLAKERQELLLEQAKNKKPDPKSVYWKRLIKKRLSERIA